MRGLTSSKLECLQKSDLKVAPARNSPFKKSLEPLHEVSVQGLSQFDREYGTLKDHHTEVNMKLLNTNRKGEYEPGPTDEVIARSITY